MEKVYFAILTWNSEKVIGSCIDSITALSNLSAAVYIVDNGSSDGTREIIQKKIDACPDWCKIDLIENEKNIGTAAGRNLALRKILKTAGADEYICILDSDTKINGSAIHELICELQKDPCNAIAGPQMHLANGLVQKSAREIPTIWEKVRNVLSDSMTGIETHPEEAARPAEYLLSACWLVRVSAVQKVGLMNEVFFYAPEDVEFCIRTWQNGLRVVYCPKAKIVHHWQRISRKKLLSRHNFEHLKGLLYIAWKYNLWFSNDHMKRLVF